MKFSTKEDIEAPAAWVFAELTDFDNFERAALRRGARVTRRDKLAAPGEGMAWDIAFRWRGRERKIAAELVRWQPGHELAFAGRSPGFELDLSVGLVEMGQRRTRLAVELDVRPRTLAARIMMQSVKLAKNRLSRKFAGRVRMMAEELELRHAEAMRAIRPGAGQ